MESLKLSSVDIMKVMSIEDIIFEEQYLPDSEKKYPELKFLYDMDPDKRTEYLKKAFDDFEAYGLKTRLSAKDFDTIGNPLPIAEILAVKKYRKEKKSK